MSTVKEIKGMVGMSGMSLSGATIMEVKPPYKGTGQYGPYTFQTITVMQDGEKMNVVLENIAEYPNSIIGSLISISPVLSEKDNTLTGVKYEKRKDKNLYEHLELRVTKHANIRVGTPPPLTQESIKVIDKVEKAFESPASVITRHTTDPMDEMIHCLNNATMLLTSKDMVNSVMELKKLGYTTDDWISVALTLFINRAKASQQG